MPDVADATIPINDGSFRSLNSIVPPGRVVSAMRPAPMRWWMTFPMTIIDTIFKALAPAIARCASSPATMPTCDRRPSTASTRTRGNFFIAGFGPLGGGWGAKRTEDGISATVCLNDGDTHNAPCEQMEAKYPVLVERHALIPDTGGAGEIAAALASSASCGRARISQHPHRTQSLPAVGPRRRARGRRQ